MTPVSTYLPLLRTHGLRYFINAAVIILLATVAIAPAFSHLLLGVLAALGLGQLVSHRDTSRRLPAEIIALAALPIVALLVTLMALMAGIEIPRLGWRKMEDLGWVLLFIPLWYLWRQHLDLRALAIGVVLGAAIAGIWALVEVSGKPVGVRALGGTGKPIVFGILCMALATAAAGLGFCFYRHRWWQLGIYSAVVLGILGAVISGSRGAYLAVPLIGMLFWFVYRKYTSRKILVGTLIGAVAMLAMAWHFTTMPARIAVGWNQTLSYLTSDNPASEITSLGLRFEMWKAAVRESMHHPFIGVGLGNVKQVFSRAAQRGDTNNTVAIFDHTHNEFINAALTRGLPGLAASLAVLIVPALAFGKSLSTHRCIAMTGLGVVLLFGFSALSDSVFYFKKDLLLYATLIVALSAILWRRKNDAGSVC